MKENRHVAILQEVDEKGLVTVKELVALLGVTDMTIRRDLIALEEQGLLVRVHGGAHRKTVDSLREISRKDKSISHAEDKRAIAEEAARLIVDGDTVFIGAGTTAALIGDYLLDKKISLVTNSLLLFERVKDMGQLDVFLVGGRYRLKTDTFVGQFTNKVLQDIRIDKAFLGADGIADHSLTTNNEEEGQAIAILLKQAKEKYILADPSKFERQGFFSFASLDDVTAVISSASLGSDLQARYQDSLRLSS